jgi:cell division protein FtsQ
MSGPSSRSILPSNRRLEQRRDEPSTANVRTRNVRADEKAAPWDPDALWRNLRMAARVLLAVAVLGAGVAAATYARRYVTSSPRFGLRDLRIEGNHRRSKEWVATTAGVGLGQNVVELDLEAARAKLERDPWIERATLSRRLPASLSIEIVEREAAAIVALPAGTFLATVQGELFKRLEEGDPNDLPIVTGISSEDAGGDREATAQLVKRSLDLGVEIEHVGLLGGRVEELHVDGDGGITAVIGKRAVRVAFGRGPYRAKVKLGLKIEAELVRRGARPTMIFLDDDQHPDRIVVRLVSALPPAQVTLDGEPANPAQKPKVIAKAKEPKGKTP